MKCAFFSGLIVLCSLVSSAPVSANSVGDALTAAFEAAQTEDHLFFKNTSEKLLTQLRTMDLGTAIAVSEKIQAMASRVCGPEFDRDITHLDNPESRKSIEAKYGKNCLQAADLDVSAALIFMKRAIAELEKNSSFGSSGNLPVNRAVSDQFDKDLHEVLPFSADSPSGVSASRAQ